MSAARLKLKSANCGLPRLILSKSSRVIFKHFLSWVLIRFIEEKARSHSAVLTRMSAPILARLREHVTEWLISAQKVEDLLHWLWRIVVLDQSLKAFPLTCTIIKRVRTFTTLSWQDFHFVLATCDEAVFSRWKVSGVKSTQHNMWETMIYNTLNVFKLNASFWALVTAMVKSFKSVEIKFGSAVSLYNTCLVVFRQGWMRERSTSTLWKIRDSRLRWVRTSDNNYAVATHFVAFRKAHEQLAHCSLMLLGPDWWRWKEDCD
jgi:hypothetical protein